MTVKIVIIDNEVGELAYLIPLLQAENYEIKYHANGWEEIDYFIGYSPELFVVNANILKIDFLEKKLKSVGSSINVVFVGNIEQIESRIKEFEWATVDFIVKNLGDKRLILRIKNHLSLKKRNEDIIKYRNFFDLSIDLLCIANGQGYFLSVNNSFERELGYTLEEITAEPFVFFVHPDDRKATLAELEKINKGENALSFENRYRCKDGSYKWLVWNSRFHEGKIYANARNITQTKQTQETIQEQANLLNASTDIIFAQDINGQILYFNKTAQNFYGWKNSAGLTTNVCDILFGGSVEKFDEVLQTVLNEGSWKGELSSLMNNGKYIFFESRWSIVKDFYGQTKSILVINSDITNQKQLFGIAKGSPGIIYILVMRPDGSRYFEYMSSAFEDILEIPVEQVMNDYSLYYNHIHPEDVDGYNQAVQKSLENVSCFEHRWRYITPSGKIKWVSCKSNLVKRVNGEIAWYGFANDITLMEEMRQLQKLKHNKLKETNAELSRLVNLDSLTLIANRRCFDEKLGEVWNDAFFTKEKIALLLFDLDCFKLYNDYYGHPQGDACLRKIAQSVQKIVSRHDDLFARYGGEEFVVILPHTDARGAITFSERIHKAVRTAAIPHAKSQVSNLVTISLGISAIIPSDKSNPAMLIAQADQALYRAKKEGRNCSMVYNNVKLPRKNLWRSLLENR